MRIVVTEDCAGTGQCVAIAPNTFELDVDGLSTVKATPEGPSEVDEAKVAAELCPMGAIRIEL